ncbi:hypothetical protein D3C80_1392630 [compost metagenome]
MDDVLGQVLLAAGDEDLVAGEPVAAIKLRLGARANQAQVGAGVRLGQAHHPGPLAAVQLGQVARLEFCAGVGGQLQAGASGQHRVQGEGQVGRVEHLLDLRAERLGHAHAAVRRIAANADPAALGPGAPGRGKTGRCAHRAVLPVAALLVAAAVERGDGRGGQLAGLLQHGGRGIDIRHAGQRRQPRPLRGSGEDLLEDEAHVAQGSLIVGHGCIPRVILVVFPPVGANSFASAVPSGE